MSKKAKLLDRLKGRPKDFTWNETKSLMTACSFELQAGSGSGRMFVHRATKVRVRLHEPHPQKTLLPYMIGILIEGLEAAGEL